MDPSTIKSLLKDKLGIKKDIVALKRLKDLNKHRNFPRIIGRSPKVVARIDHPCSYFV